ncbi:DUF4123 domain-containing protein [Pseudoxanthomonas mexicana]|uniref:DUF4123 domain-containing protein n=1 Tax=Pseudoxanthomonas mexicana TaxID=128785 RepID=UPI00398B9F6F
MSEWVFANGRPNEVQTEVILQEVLRPVKESLWLLMDLALMDHAAVASFARHAGIGLKNAFAGSGLAAFGDKAPHFVKLPDDAASRHAIARKFIRLAGNATAMSWLRSEKPERMLQEIFAYLAEVRVEERRMPIHCRFADTRVLPELLQVLSVEQRRRVKCVVESWSWIGRTGELRSWGGGSEGPGEKDESPVLRLSIEQFRRMQRAAEPDAVFLMLSQKTPEIVPQSEYGGFHARLCGLLDAADGFGVKAAKDRLQFVVLGLTCGEDFHAVPELQPTWRLVSGQGASLHDLMQGWSDSLWQRLDARNGKNG